ncbi:sulfur oxidation protein [Sulfolobus sp. S-194]|uniref:sulfur oxygenase/reductase n=1 Tax=Sulfolobus sp. S-194 TaxID=2512240 RepID=UPI001436F1E9|nr:sulfur oxygenase reductase family protein [Sulfolobus sp. S-194]QIW23786.1 sulfur oxidation protein [Sulfolobus sp. S-194]
MPKPYVAINMVEVRNDPKTLELFGKVGPKVCMVTARHPGFVGFQNHVQIGVVPLGTRWGGAKMEMSQEMHSMMLMQYTFWKNWKDHEEMHKQNWANLFRLCLQCADQMIWGPYEPLYEIVYANMPLNTEMTDFTVMVGKKFAAGEAVSIPPISQPYGKRVVAFGEHIVKEGLENQFEEYAIKTLEAFRSAPGFLGGMILKEIGVSPLGSLQLNAKGFHQILETANGMDVPEPVTIYEAPEFRNRPQRYIVHTEWSDTNALMFGLGRVLIYPEVRQIHDKVLDTVVYGPYIRVLNPMMEGTYWREYLNEYHL